MTTLFIGIIIGALIGALLVYFFLKSSTTSRMLFDELNNNFIRANSDLQNANLKINELENSYQSEKQTNLQQTEVLNQLRTDLAKIAAENNSQNLRIEEQTEINSNQSTEIRKLNDDKNELISIKSHLTAQNEGLQKLLDSQKEEIEKMQALAKEEFQNLANRILEEKSKKFTDTNKENLDLLLKPLGENLENFKKKVSEVYENEARERFSLNNTIN